MNEEPVFSARNRWFVIAVAVTSCLAVSSFAIGFLWLPSIEAGARPLALWARICTAAGLAYAAPADQVVVATAYRTSNVVVSSAALRRSPSGSAGHGASLALQCTMCHGERGMSEADSPNLAGQYDFAIYKQLQDYQAGARTNVVMSPHAAALSDQDMRDLASYFAYLPRMRAEIATGTKRQATTAPTIVESGAPLRGVAPCAACHGGLAYKLGSAWLEGQSVVYLARQLRSFAAGRRHNDINAQMRNIARAMTQVEIDAAARYYAGADTRP